MTSDQTPANRPDDNAESGDAFDEFLAQAINTRVPSAETTALVKAAFTWRTIDAELMELSYDSAQDLATVRDVDAPRTIEFAAGDTSIVAELGPSSVTGHVLSSDTSPDTITLRSLTSHIETPIDEFGSFNFTQVDPGRYRLELDDAQLCSSTFLVGDAT